MELVQITDAHQVVPLPISDNQTPVPSHQLDDSSEKISLASPINKSDSDETVIDNTGIGQSEMEDNVVTERKDTIGSEIGSNSPQISPRGSVMEGTCCNITVVSLVQRNVPHNAPFVWLCP